MNRRQFIKIATILAGGAATGLPLPIRDVFAQTNNALLMSAATLRCHEHIYSTLFHLAKRNKIDLNQKKLVVQEVNTFDKFPVATSFQLEKDVFKIDSVATFERIPIATKTVLKETGATVEKIEEFDMIPIPLAQTIAGDALLLQKVVRYTNLAIGIIEKIEGDNQKVLKLMRFNYPVFARRIERQSGFLTRMQIEEYSHNPVPLLTTVSENFIEHVIVTSYDQMPVPASIQILPV